MKNKINRKFLVLLTLPLLFGICSSSIDNGIINSSVRQPTLKDWVNKGVSQSGNSFTFAKKDASLSTKTSLQNFILTLHLTTTAGAEGVILFHTSADSRSMTKGYQVIINNSDYRTGNPQKTGSLAFIRNNFVRNASDEKGFDMQISVKSNHISIKVNDKLISDYIEPDKPQRMAGKEGMILSSGRVIIQKNSAAGSMLIDRISLASLPDSPRETPDPLTVDSVGEALTKLNQMGFPVIDFHGHLKGGLTSDQVSEHGRKYGYNFGIITSTQGNARRLQLALRYQF